VIVDATSSCCNQFVVLCGKKNFAL